MSEKARAMAEKIAKLPEALQDKFMDRLDGATMALDLMQAATPADTGGENEKKGG